MWFRNLQVYRLDRAFKMSPEVFEERLQGEAFTSCGRMDMLAQGWAPPLGRHGTGLVHAAGGYWMICARKEEKIIPAGVVRQMLEDKVAEREAAEGREIYRREKLRLKDEIIVDLLPRALTRVSNQYAYIDVRNALLIVDSASAGRAEDLIGLLRNTLGRFPATPLQAKQSLSSVMTRWLSGDSLPAGLALGDACELRHPNPDGGIVSCKHQDLSAGEVRQHLKQGKQAVKLALGWQERISFLLHDDLSIKRLHFEDVIREAEQDTEAEDPVSRFDLDFSLMALELAAFIPALLDALGGEAIPQAVTEGGTTVVAGARDTAPVDAAELEPA